MDRSTRNSATSALLILAVLFVGFVGGYTLSRSGMGEQVPVGPPRDQELTLTPLDAQPAPKLPEPEPDSPEPGDSVPAEVDFPVDINTADMLTLQRIPGVGEELASRIVLYRIKNGAFSSFSELLSISGIGEKTLEKMMPYITLTEDKP